MATDTHKNNLRLIIAIMVTGFVAFAALNFIQPILPLMGESYGVPPATAGMLMSSGMLGVACMMAGITFFASGLPRQKTILFSISVCSLLTVALGIIPNFTVVLLSRFLEGLCVAFVPVFVLVYLQEELPADQVPFLSGLYISGTTIGGLVGRLMVSGLAEFFSWQSSVIVVGLLLCALTAMVWFLLPEESKVKQHSSTFDRKAFSMQNKGLFGLCLIAFCIMGSFVASYNFIPYVLRAAPYYLSQTFVGMIYLVQISGSLSSGLSGKFSARWGTVRVIYLELTVMFLGIFLTMHDSLLLKLVGMTAINFGFFGAHACAASWVGSVSIGAKVTSLSVYYFFYYCGASFLGGAGGYAFEFMGWLGIVILVVCAVLVSALTLYNVYKLQLSRKGSI